jgi:hypothetical protein
MEQFLTKSKPKSDVSHLSFVICHLSFVICHLSFVICHLSFVICHLSLVISFSPRLLCSSAPQSPIPIFNLAVHERWYTTKHENLTPTTPLHPYTPTPFFKLAVHERWYTTKHENLTPTTPLHPYTPTPFFKLEGKKSALILPAL